MEFKTQVMDDLALNRSIKRISHEILEKNKGTNDLILVGIKRRGVPLALSIAKYIQKIEGSEVKVCTLDITFYRDDLSKIYDEPSINKQDLGLDVNGKRVVLVDDVIYTGRTARAAMDALLNVGRPSLIQLAVIVDRGHRELPITPNYIGKNIPTSKEERISVCVKEIDKEDSVYLIKKS